MEETTLDTFPMRNMANIDPLKSGGEIGKRLLPQIIDAYAEHQPDRIWGTQSKSSDISEGFNDITFKQLAHCINHLAFLIERRVGRSSSFEAISYIGSSDLRYCMIAWAAVKCGYQVCYCQCVSGLSFCWKLTGLLDTLTVDKELRIWESVSPIRPELHKVLLLNRMGAAGREVETDQDRPQHLYDPIN